MKNKTLKHTNHEGDTMWEFIVEHIPDKKIFIFAILILVIPCAVTRLFQWIRS
ncbi:hypothetical protein [Thermoactinomyces vulgaris]|jgi:hypothetical protein|uniref:hypothetical protein n=1 Tax=Thermoactinomyces vulgaris TaxID=2026 RepID=UPI0015EF2845|nr:hypothetical protein [Thermoactinomyces vulgaris]